MKAEKKKTDALRSEIMRAVRSKNTKPELIVRRLAYSLGYRFRLHRTDLPGKPDLVFAGRKCVIFVHGCFWHGHGCKRGSRIPKTNVEYWLTKIAKNVARDNVTLTQIVDLKWRYLIVWECELRDQSALIVRLTEFLSKYKSDVS